MALSPKSCSPMEIVGPSLAPDEVPPSSSPHAASDSVATTNRAAAARNGRFTAGSFRSTDGDGCGDGAVTDAGQATHRRPPPRRKDALQGAEEKLGEHCEQGDEKCAGEQLAVVLLADAGDDEGPEPTEADERAERRGRNDLYRGHADAGNDQRQRGRCLDPEQHIAAAHAHTPRRFHDA